MFYSLLFHTVLPLYRLRIKKISGLENVPLQPPFIIAANHLNWLDPWILIAALKSRLKTQVHFISKTNNYWWLGAIPIDKDNKEECLLKAAGRLKNNKLVAIFPEGQRTDEILVNQGKTGVARLALLARVPVLPVGLKGPIGRYFLQTIFSFFKGSRPFSVKIGQPMEFKKYYDREVNGEVLREITEKVMRELAELAKDN